MLVGPLNAGISLSNYGPSNPLYIAHRISGLRFPEFSMASYRAAYAAGLRVFEADCSLLADGGIAIMHDLTADRTTTATGNISTLNSQGFRSLVMDTEVWHGGGFGNLNPPLLEELLYEFKGRVIFSIEAKTDAAGVAIAAALVAAGIPKDQALVTGYSTAGIAPALAAGYQGCFQTEAGTENKATIWATGARWVASHWPGGGWTDQMIRDWIAYGFKYIPATVTRRYLRDQALALGVAGFFTDDAEYTAATAPLATKDSFAEGKWMPGMLATVDTTNLVNRGKMTGGKWAWETATGTNFILLGWLCPIKGKADADDFTVYSDVTYTSAAAADITRWPGFFHADQSMGDQDYQGAGATSENGYLAIYRKNRQVVIFRVVAGVATALNSSAVGTTIADGEKVRLLYKKTPTAVTASILSATDNTVQATLTVATTQFKGGYFHAGKLELACTFENMIVV